ncbi:MAG: hypothetical protein ACRD1V_09830 [Vicinamibacterales bacterium]
MRLKILYDAANRSVRINGRDIVLRDDNVLFVDQVDDPAGPRFVRTAHVEPRMPSFSRIGLVLRESRDVMDYLECRARWGNPAIYRLRSTICMTNLGRE